MYPGYNDNPYNEEDDSMLADLEASDIDGIVEGIWAAIVKENRIRDEYINEPLAAQAMIKVMNQIGSGPNGEESGEALAFEIRDKVKTFFSEQSCMNKEELRQ